MDEPTAPGFGMTTHRKKPGVAFWASVVLVAVLAYPLSYGPVMWITVRSRGRILGLHVFFTLYEPIRLASKFSRSFGSVMDSYAKVGLPAGVSFTVSRGGWAFRARGWDQGVQE
jgi:hypothetical protein